MADSRGAMSKWLLLSVLVVVLDQWTKGLATAGLQYGQPVPVTGFFDLTLLHNTGAAFSFLSDAAGWQRWFFTVVAVIMGGVLLVWVWRLPPGSRWLACALCLVLGGALGNLWDRIALGYVVDFISVHYAGWYFPAFNVADSAITVGAGMLIVDIIRGEPGHREGGDD